MNKHLGNYFALILPAVMLAIVASNAPCAFAQNNLLSGFVYIDRDNNGQLAFSDDLHPEWVLSNVEIKLYSVVNNVETLLSTIFTGANGQYTFSNLNAGTYSIRQTQPIGYVDGIDTLGVIHGLNGSENPAGSSVGTSPSSDYFKNIVLVDNSRGDMFNFGERGLAPGYVSKRYLLGTADPMVFTPPPELAPEPATIASAATALLASLGWFRRRGQR